LVLGREIGPDFRAVPIADPGVVVDQPPAMNLGGPGLREGGRGRREI
jgi:hypothetical protein